MNRNRRVPFPGCYRGWVLLAQGANRRTRPGLPARHQRQQRCRPVSTPLRRLSGQRRRRSAWKPGSKGSTQVWTRDPGQACLDRFGEPSKPVKADDQHVLEAAVGQFGRTRWPQTSPLSAAWTQIPSTCLTPSVSTPTAMWAWRFTVPVLVPDLHHHSVQKDHRVERLQRPVLPLSDLVQHGLGDIADGLMGQLSTQPRGEVMLNLTDRHTGPHKGLMIMSSRPPSLRSPVGTSREVNEPLRSPGARPARPPYPRSWGWCRYGSFPEPRPAGSCFS